LRQKAATLGSQAPITFALFAGFCSKDFSLFAPVNFLQQLDAVNASGIVSGVSPNQEG
jgi:hypothetical protein